MTSSRSSATVASPAPLVELVPPRISSVGPDMVELAGMFDLVADPWQANVLDVAGGEREDGKHAALEVGVVVPRQNGKDEILIIRTLGGLLILGERLITFSAHQFDTSLEAFRRLLFFFENFDDLSKRVKRVSKSHGEEGIELKGGQRVRFRTRTAGGGRGFTGDCIFLNEAMILRESSLGALFSTLSARPNPQIWYAGSPVDQEIHEHGVVLARVRERALRGDSGLAYLEYAAAESMDALDPDDRDGWQRANPALGIRITTEFVEAEQRALAPKTFAVERLGVGDWPPTGEALTAISLESWRNREDPASDPKDSLVFAFDVAPDRSVGAVAVAGRRADGLMHVELVERGQGAGWILGRIPELLRRHKGAQVVCDEQGAAGSLVPAFKDRGIEVRATNAREHAQACGMFYDAVEDDGLRHLGQPELTGAIKGATKRPLGDAWAWSRKNSAVDISPLVACTLALWGAATLERTDVWLSFT